MLNREKTLEQYEKLCQILPGGVSSPIRACKSVEEHPLVVSHGKKDTIYDVDGNHFIDYCQSWGALIHGHAHEEVMKAVKNQLKLGTSFGITTSIEGKLATEIQKRFPSIEKLRFVSSGTESTMSAMRLCRGYTKKRIIIKFDGHYHGHADSLLVKAGSGLFDLPASSSAGIPEDFIKHTLSLPFNDVERFKGALQDPEVRNNLAGVILEPIAGNMGVVPATQEFLSVLREETLKAEALLIFDEVITGFRVAFGGAQEIYQITPDLTCLGKIMGGGFSAAAFGGKKEIMDHLAPLGSVYQAGTLSGNPVAMQAGLKTLELLTKTSYQELKEKTDQLLDPIREAIKKHSYPTCIQQSGSMFTLFFGKKTVQNFSDAKELDFKKFALFFRYLLSHHIYFPPAQQEAAFISLAHSSKNIDKTIKIMLKFIN
jgi:glutamate-1-semialdehyde 2,1-aminomutase